MGPDQKYVEWQWGAKESKAFQEIKDLLTRAPVMANHRQGATTRLTTDASPVEVGAILEQKTTTRVLQANILR